MLNAPAQPKQFIPNQVEFYHIEICPLADGSLSVAVSATMCPYEGELTSQELHYDRAHSLDEALAVIKKSVSLQ
jgi:hypothetical protein